MNNKCSRHYEAGDTDGLAPIMFDRYARDNSTKLEPQQKLYFEKEGSPSYWSSGAEHHVIFVGAQHELAPKRLRDKRKYKDIANVCLSFVI